VTLNTSYSALLQQPNSNEIRTVPIASAGLFNSMESNIHCLKTATELSVQYVKYSIEASSSIDKAVETTRSYLPH